jgi:cyd operon protein YbgT
MWYFAWILGVTMAVLLAIVNAMMCDAQAQSQSKSGKDKA